MTSVVLTAPRSALNRGSMLPSSVGKQNAVLLVGSDQEPSTLVEIVSDVEAHRDALVSG